MRGQARKNMLMARRGALSGSCIRQLAENLKMHMLSFNNA
jgi:hypothetical protein